MDLDGAIKVVNLRIWEMLSQGVGLELVPPLLASI